MKIFRGRYVATAHNPDNKIAGISYYSDNSSDISKASSYNYAPPPHNQHKQCKQRNTERHSDITITNNVTVIQDGAIVVRKGIIEACGRWEQIRQQYRTAATTGVVDLTDCVLIPGLINAHTHLELSHLKNKVPYNGNFIDWVRNVTKNKITAADVLTNIISNACQQLLRSGVTTVGDISSNMLSWITCPLPFIRRTSFIEVFGLSPRDAEITRDYLLKIIASAQPYLHNNGSNTNHPDNINPAGSLVKPGISPHALYSAGQTLYELAAELAKTCAMPLTTHLAENPADDTLLCHARGPWRDYLTEIGKWNKNLKWPGTRSVPYFLQMKLHNQPFALAHVNYISDHELDQLAQSPHSVVYCPRAHAFFGHPPHRFRDMLAKGINVCLGTDSLASNQSLSILDEMRFIRRHYPDVPAETLLKMATINAAIALGWQGITGTLEPGKQADITALALTPGNQPLKLKHWTDILNTNTACTVMLTALQGRIVYTHPTWQPCTTNTISPQ